MLFENATTTEKIYKNNWIKSSDLITENEKPPLTFLYVGSDDLIKSNFLRQFHSGTSVLDFAHTKRLVNDSPTLQLAAAIFIDLPFNLQELKNFLSWLKSKKELQKAVVIYNEDKLTPDLIVHLKQLDILDDIVNFNSTKIDYSKKILFLTHCKTYQRAPHMRVIKKEVIRESTVWGLSYLLKRTVDIIFSVIALVILLPVFLVIAIIIELESKGPVFYTSLRAGRRYKIFKFYKFRTMIVNADDKIEKLVDSNQYHLTADGPIFYKINNDPRVTRFGRFLRNTSLDELPQLLNVLKVDMSVVGNRPLPLYEA